ncbi:MAG: hypothetical protein AAB789_00500 [Patescibacteria group bacterium]
MVVAIKTGVVVAVVKAGAVGVVVAVGTAAVGVVVAIIIGVDVETAAETGLLAVIITAAVPGFWVAPHAPSEVFITPPSIYMHFGAVVSLSYTVTPLAVPPPTVSDWVLTLCAIIFPPSSILHKPLAETMLLTFNMEKPLRLRSLFRVVKLIVPWLACKVEVAWIRD